VANRLTRFLDWLNGGPTGIEQRYSFSDYANEKMSFGGWQYPLLGLTSYGEKQESIGNSFTGYVNGAYKADGVVFATVLARMLLFTEARFQFQRLEKGRPGDLFGSPALELLEHPWPNGTTGELLARMEQDVSLSGNFYAVRERRRLRRLRPDWVSIVLTAAPDQAVESDVAGYAYHPGGPGSRTRPEIFLPGEVCHWSPIPDPEAQYRGMSWLTPVVREVQADRAATAHKLKFFENAAPQPYDAGVLTPTGWVEMGDLKVGDRVFGSDGKPKTVLGVYPQGIQDIYRVTFSSGATTECTADHLWTVANAYDRQRGVTRTQTLEKLVQQGIRYDSGPYKWSVPLVDPMEFDDPGDLPMDPYLLGSLLGDGSFRSNGKGSGGVAFAACSSDVDEQEALLSALLPAGVTISRRNRGGWSEFYFKGPGGPRPNPFTQVIRDMGLFDVPGYEKSIPQQYLRASVTQRVGLLQGLIDTDGNIDGRQPNTVRFDTTSQVLAQQVVELASSLGAVASVRLGRAATERGRAQWHVTISRLPEWINPCRLARKAKAYSPKFRGGRWRFIQSVEYVGPKPAQCIAVDSSDHLYVTDGYVLTHNTPNLAVSLKETVTEEQFRAFMAAMNASHQGVDNAYKTLFLGGGADVTVVGSDLRQLSFKDTQGAGETRITAAGGVPAVIVGLSEGLQAATYSNYGQARRKFGDHWARPQWRSACAALQTVLQPPAGTRLWYDDRDIAFLREDQLDSAEIAFRKAQTIRALTDSGYTAESVVGAVLADDFALLSHSGLFSVQLQPPGTTAPAPAPAKEAP
jgi:phage portal protein BeeE